MKALGLACVLTFWLCLPTNVFADEPAYLVARDFTAEGKVLELDIPPEFDGMRFFFVFQNDHSEPHIEFVVARAGTHCYETRHLPEWQGTMKVVAISLKGVAGRVKEP